MLLLEAFFLFLLNNFELITNVQAIF